MIISFSGFDGSGKTTQIQLLLQGYQAHGFNICSIYDINPSIRYHSVADLKDTYNYFKNYDVIHARFRLNSDINNNIMKILEYSDFSDIDLAKKAAIQGYNDYIELYQHVIMPLIKANKIIISDRHYYDEIAFKTIYGCSYDEMVQLYSNVIQPDFAFYIDIHPHTAIYRNKDRADGQTTIYKSLDYAKSLKSIFDRLSDTTNLVKIDGERSTEAINSDIINTLSMYNSKLSFISLYYKSLQHSRPYYNLNT